MSNPFNRKIYNNHPPVPQPLKEALKDYPELVARLEEALTSVGLEPFMSKNERLDQFDHALSALEGRLGSFMSEAAQEIRAAETSGDAKVIARAKAKKSLMSDCRVRQLSNGVSELTRFFD